MLSGRRRGKPPAYERAAVVYANYCQFGSGQRVHNGPVQSRMLLWCEAGVGHCVIDGRSCAVAPNQFFLLPWMHDIEYLADSDEPFLLGGVHIVPDYRAKRTFTYRAAHHVDSDLFDAPDRCDRDWPALRGLISGTLLNCRGLGLLARYCVQQFLDGVRSPRNCRHLAQMLLCELERGASAADERSAPMPLQVQQMMQYVISHVSDDITIADLMRQSQWSASTLQRRFRQYLGCSPVEWIQRYRFRRACELLGTSRLPVGQVGRQVGFADPYYFSRWFHHRAGRTAMAYRRQTAIW